MRPEIVDYQALAGIGPSWRTGPVGRETSYGKTTDRVVHGGTGWWIGQISELVLRNTTENWVTPSKQ